MANQNSF